MKATGTLVAVRIVWVMAVAVLLGVFASTPVRAQTTGLTPVTGTIGQPLSFSAVGVSGPPGISQYQWDFGDGTIDLGQVVTHAYVGSPGTYVVTLSALGPSGLVAIGSTTATISAAPTGNAPASSPPAQSSPTLSPDQAALWSGHWCSGPLGDITITVSGNAAGGSYPTYQGSFNGTIGVQQPGMLIFNGNFTDKFSQGTISWLLDTSNPNQFTGNQQVSSGAPAPSWTATRPNASDQC